MAERVINIRPTVKQMQFLRMRAKHCGYGGARGGGKSWVVRVKACLLANRFGRPDKNSEGIKICIVRKTLEDVRKNHIVPMKSMLQGLARFNQQERTFWFPNGASIHFEYYAAEKDVEHFQGVEYDVIFIEEATQFNEEWLKYIAASCRGANDYPHRIYYTCNPGGPGHAYIKRIFIDRIYKDDENPDDYEFVQAKVTDNKVLMELDPDYIKFLRNLPPKQRAAWLEGSWEIYSGQYFSEFQHNPDGYESRRWTHVIHPIKIRRHWTIYRGLDWGFFRPFSVGWYAVDEEGIMYRFRELYGVQKSGKESIANEGVQWPPEKVFKTIAEIENSDPDLKGREIIGIADPAIFQSQTGVSIADTAMQCGVYFRPGDNTRIPGWMQCRYRLQFNEDGIPRFYVFDTCKEFIRTITTLQHDERNVEDLETLKSEDHIADEWRYVCMQNMIRPIVEEPEYTPMLGADPLEMFGGNGR
jgi:PBSX family phage terminase large subunit